MRRAHRLGLIYLAPVSLIASTAAAFTLLPVTFEELTDRAESIVFATVVGHESTYGAECDLILTHTTLAVEETLAGGHESTLTVSEYGGCIGDRCLAVPGLPRFEVGDRVVLFVCRDALGLRRTCGAIQGRFRVTTKAKTAWVSGEAAGSRIDLSLDALRDRILARRAERR